MCLMSCSKLICFHNIHLEKFQNGYSNEATKTNGGLDAKGSYPNKIIHHIHYGASIFCRVLQKQKKSFKRSHIASNPGYWDWRLLSMQSFPFSVCLFVHWFNKNLLGTFYAPGTHFLLKKNQSKCFSLNFHSCMMECQ